jgi:CRISPR-associated protein Cmr6
MSDQIPLMFQAQIAGRSQIQKLEDLKKKAEKLGVQKESLQQQAYSWSDQWCRAIDRKQLPKFDPSTQTKDYEITWRMVTNSGQDAGVIRPVIGARGWAFFPGSSMKGAFRRSCSGFWSAEEILQFCGGDEGEGGFKPGILRFQGGYPKDATWINDSLVDVVHPQENWQLDGQKENGAFIQISLYQPTFVFGISSSETLTSIEWETIWKIWDQAMGRGIGSRVSAGYGQTKVHGKSSLLTVRLRGDGIASQRIDKVGEFRPNFFKAALRGHTQRLLSGVADWKTVEQLTKALWGGFGKDGAIVGQLGIAFSAPDLELNNRNRATVYSMEDAALNILMMQDVSEQQRKNLGVLTTQLIKFSMLLGGFGKSWRRIDHRRFYPSYLNDSRKCTIGCHWEFVDQSLKSYGKGA